MFSRLELNLLVHDAVELAVTHTYHEQYTSLIRFLRDDESINALSDIGSIISGKRAMRNNIIRSERIADLTFHEINTARVPDVLEKHFGRKDFIEIAKTLSRLQPERDAAHESFHLEMDRRR